MHHLHLLLQSFSVCRWDEAPSGKPGIGFASRDAVRTWLRPCKSSFSAMVALRDVLQQVGGGDLLRLSDEQVLEELAALIDSSRVLVCPLVQDLPPQGGGGGGGGGPTPPPPGPPPGPKPPGPVPPPPPPPPPPAQKTHWIEIELKHEDGKPAAGVAYVIVTADDASHGGTTDGKGKGRLDGIVPGNCKVSFPDMGDEEWRA